MTNIDILKIDTEGYEFNVLKGTQKKISEIKYVLIENQFNKMYKNVDCLLICMIMICFSFSIDVDSYEVNLLEEDNLINIKRTTQNDNLSELLNNESLIDIDFLIGINFLIGL